MKIAYLLQAGVPDLFTHPRSGPAVHVEHVCNELQELGHQVTVLTFLAEGLWKSSNLVDFERLSITWMDGGPLRWFERGVRRLQFELQLPYAAFFESVRFAAVCRQELAGYDLLYERMGWMGYGGALAAKLLGVPLVLEVNGDHLSEFEQLGFAPQGAQKWLSLRLMHWATHQAVHSVATGEGWRQRFIERWQVEPQRVSVVENGSEIVTRLHRHDLRAFQSHEEQDETVRIVYVGAFEPWHGILILLEALAKSISHGAPVKLELIGTGSELPKIIQSIDDLDLASCVTLTGHVGPEVLAQHLAHADIGVSPYCGRVEYSGLKLLDYKAAGLATIASGRDGQPFILRHAHTGWIVPPCDADALATAILQLSRQSDLRRRIGQAARIEAEQVHSWRHTAQELDGIFNQTTMAPWRATA